LCYPGFSGQLFSMFLTLLICKWGWRSDFMVLSPCVPILPAEPVMI